VFHGTPEEENSFRRLHLTYDLFQRLYQISKKQRDQAFVESLRHAAKFKELSTAQQFDAIVDGLLRKMKDDLTEYVSSESFTFTRWII